MRRRGGQSCRLRNKLSILSSVCLSCSIVSDVIESVALMATLSAKRGSVSAKMTKICVFPFMGKNYNNKLDSAWLIFKIFLSSSMFYRLHKDNLFIASCER